LRMLQLRREKEEAKQGDLSGDDDFETDDGDLKIPELPPIDGSPNASTNIEAVENMNAKKGRKISNAVACVIIQYVFLEVEDHLWILVRVLVGK